MQLGPGTKDVANVPERHEPPGRAAAGLEDRPPGDWDSRSFWRGLGRVVWAATAFWCALLLVWSLVLPVFRSADESSHISAVLHLEHQRTWPGFKALPWDPGVEAARDLFLESGGLFDTYPVLQPDDVPLRGDRPSFTDLGSGGEGGGRVTVGQHPPGYYAVLAGVSTALPDGISADKEVWLLRLTSVLFLVPLPVILAAAARHLGGSRSTIATAAILPISIPQFAALGGAVNNDNLLTLMSAAVTLGCVVIASGDTRIRTAVAVGLATAVALLTKAFAIPLVIVVLLAYLLAASRSERWKSVLPAASAFAATAMLGGWWWVHNLIRYGQLQPAGHKAERSDGPLPLLGSLGEFVGHFIEIMPGRFWAMLSVKSFDDPGYGAFPWRFSATLSVLLIGLLVASFVPKRLFGARRSDRGVLVLPACLVLLILFLSTWRLYVLTETPGGVQGRYLFVGLPGVLIVLAIALGWWSRRHTRPAALPSVVALLSVLFVGASLHRAATFHWGTDRSSMSGVVESILAWSPVPSPLTLGIAVLLIAALVGLALALVQEWMRTSEPGRA